MPRRGLSVLAIPESGECMFFRTLSDASEHFCISRDRLIGCLVSGEDIDGYQFQWDIGCDEEARFACLVAYFLRCSSNSDKHRRLKEAKDAAQQSMQDLP